MKRKATDADVRAFIEAICPEATNLYMAAFDEATCLRDATELIRELRAEVLALRQQIGFNNADTLEEQREEV